MNQNHRQELLETLECPFPLDIKDINWDAVDRIVSINDTKNTVIVQFDGRRYLVDIPAVLFNAIYKAGEQNVIDSDLGFDELT